MYNYHNKIMSVINIKYAFLLFCCINVLPAYAGNPINQFSVEFYKKTSELIPDNSLIMSPISTQILLGLLSSASDGETQKEILEALHMNNTDLIETIMKEKITNVKNVNGITLKIANKIYVKDGESYELSPVFKSVAKDSYFSDVENIVFSNSIQAANNVNNWVEKETNGKIKELFSSDSFDSTTYAVLLNAIYFLGDWENPFDERSVSKRQFFVSDSETTMVDMMYQLEYFPFLDSKELDSMILSMPYKNSNSSLVIVLPKKMDGIEALENKIVEINIDDIIKRMSVERVFVEIPKFKVETTIDLKNVLPKLGVKLIFDDKKAELRKMLKTNEEIYISEAVQKAFIEVNERGTEAAAATGFKPVQQSGPDAFFKANHPFLYFLKYEDDIIFFGKYLGK